MRIYIERLATRTVGVMKEELLAEEWGVAGIDRKCD